MHSDWSNIRHAGGVLTCDMKDGPVNYPVEVCGF